MQNEFKLLVEVLEALFDRVAGRSQSHWSSK